MNITLWTLQILLALHTLTGAIWKFTNPAEKAIPSLKAIPHAVWISFSGIEIVLSVCLILPLFNRSLGIFANVAVICIAAEMLFYCIVHLLSGETNHSPIFYWGAVAVICLFIAYGRFVIQPFK